MTSAGIDWQREKWQSGFGSKFIHQGEKNAVKYADEVIVLSKGVQDYFMETYGRETHFIPNGVNVRHLPRFFDYSTELSYSKTERVTNIDDIQHPAIRNAMKMLDIENVIMMVPLSAVVMWTFGEKIGKSWKKILWQSGKIAFCFSVSIEMLQLLLRLGTFQLSDIFYNTFGGVLGGLLYCVAMKTRKRL